jgi:opacity protein-like surface antigen
MLLKDRRLKPRLLGTVAAITLTAASAAHAEMWGAVPYIGIGGGFNFASDPSVTGVADLGTSSGPYPISVTKETGLKTGGIGLITFGLDFKNGWRGELEGSYRRNSGARFNVQAEGSSSVGVDHKTYALMANIWRDFALMERLSLHVGGGLGIADQKMNVTDNYGTNTSISKTEAAYQAGVGFEYEFIPGLKGTLDYRVFGLFTRPAGNVAVLTSCGVNPPGPTCSGNTNETVSLNVRAGAVDQSVIFGLRWAIHP